MGTLIITKLYVISAIIDVELAKHRLLTAKHALILPEKIPPNAPVKKDFSTMERLSVIHATKVARPVQDLPKNVTTVVMKLEKTLLTVSVSLPILKLELMYVLNVFILAPIVKPTVLTVRHVLPMETEKQPLTAIV